MKLWLKVTRDKYELPLLVCDSRQELAAAAGIKAQTISEVMSVCRRKNIFCCYRKIEVEDEEG